MYLHVAGEGKPASKREEHTHRYIYYTQKRCSELSRKHVGEGKRSRVSLTKIEERRRNPSARVHNRSPLRYRDTGETRARERERHTHTERASESSKGRKMGG
jgi:hypothetical protein